MRRGAVLAVLAGLLLGLGPALAQRARAQGKPAAWIEIRTPHFLVISDGKQKPARRVARQLEQMRAALEQSFPSFQTWPQSSMVVLALKDEASMQALVSPVPGRKLPPLPAGVFLHSQERSCVMLRLDQDDDTFHPAYHEYVHALLALNLPQSPLWLAEGLAEFYANAQFDAHGARVGAPGWQVPYLRDRFLPPLEALRAIGPDSPAYRDPVRSQLFYAHSWALIHFLVFGPGMQQGARLNLYLSRLQQGDSEEQAFEQAFGRLADVQARFDQYLRSPALPTLRLQPLAAWDESSFVQRALPAEEWAELAASLQIPERYSGSASAPPRP